MSEGNPSLEIHEVPEARTLAFDAYGVRVAVSANDHAVLARVPEVLPPGSRRCDAGGVDHRFRIDTRDGERFDVRVGENALTWDADLELALTMLDSHLQECVALHAPGRIFVHAGAVAHRGRALLVPGASFAGKTTLVAALVQAGAVYYSDDFAPLDEQGRVHPYPKHLSIRAEDLSTTNHRVDSLGGSAGEQPLPVGAIVVARYVPGARWEPRRLSPGEAALAMLANTVPAQDRPAESLAATGRAVEDAVVLEGERGEASAIAQELLATIPV